MSPLSSDRRPWAVAAGVFLFALILRLVGIGWGLPNDLRNQSLHPDESVVYSNYAYRPNPFLPGNYNYPSLYPLLLRLSGDMAATYGNIDSPLGAPEPTSMEMQKAMLTKFSPHLRAVNLAGRTLSSIAGALTAAVIVLLLLPFVGIWGAALGGLLVSVAPSFLVHSRFQTVDVTATLFFWLALYYAVKIYRSADSKVLLRDVLLAGVFTGLSASTKYTGAVAMASVAAGLYLSEERGWLRLLGLAIVAAIITFVITTPGCLLDTKQFLFGLEMESQHAKMGQELTFVGTPPGFIYQVGNLFTGIGPLAFLIGLAGLGYGVTRKQAWIRVLTPALALHFLLIAPAADKFARYGLPLVPAVACGFAYAISAGCRRPNWRVPSVLLGGTALLGLESLIFMGFKPTSGMQCFDPRFGGLQGALRFTGYMRAEDPRDSSARYIEAQTVANRSVGLLTTPWYWTPSVIPDANFLYGFPEQVHDIAVQQYLLGTSNPRVVMLGWGQGPDLAAITSFETLPLDRIQATGTLPNNAASFITQQSILQHVRSQYVLEKAFGGIAPAVEDLQFIQPRAEVWRLRR